MFFDGSFGYNSIDHRTQQQLHTILHYKPLQTDHRGSVDWATSDILL